MKDGREVVSVLTIRLLGRPEVERDGVPVRPPRGRKAWALLAYLLLEQRPLSRSHLARLLFAEANDPLGALRWTLAELRRALDVPIAGDPVRVTLNDEIHIDVLRAGWDDPSALLRSSRELLEGLYLDMNPEFESWLGVARHRVAAAIESRLRRAAVARIASGAAAEAVAFAARVVADNPFDEANHELLVRALAMSGDRVSAEHQVLACEDLFQRELGVSPSPALRDALRVGPGTGMVRPVGGRGAALSQLEAGRAAILAGAADAGVQCLRRAVAEAARLHDDSLRCRCLAALGGALVHAVRGRDEEGAVVLQEAVLVATRAGERATAVTAHRELAYVDVQAGRRETAQEWLDRASALAETDDELAGIQGVRGMNASDIGDYGAAFGYLGESVQCARAARDDRQAAWSLSLVGRAYLLRGEQGQARRVLTQSLDLVREQRWLAFQPWPQALRGELDLCGGDRTAAADQLEQAWALACQVGDPCWESLAARGLGLVHASDGNHQLAAGWLRESTTRANRTPDRYLWMLGYALDAASAQAIECHEYDRAAPLVADLAVLASRAQMRELVVRAHLHRYRLGDSAALRAARLLSADIDNPALHDLLRMLA